MKTKHWTVKTKNGSVIVSRTGDIWEITGISSSEHSQAKVAIRIPQDGIACDPMTEGLGADQKPENIIEIEAGNGPIMGWESLDDEDSYLVAGVSVPATVLEVVAKWSGLILPDVA